MTFDPEKTIIGRVRKHIVRDPASRWADLSSRIARWGALAQGAIALLPAGTLTAAQVSIVAVVFFVAIGASKLVAEEKNKPGETE